MNHIIEYIGKEGVRTTPSNRRLYRPSWGDPVDVSALPDYPFNGRDTARINHIDRGDGRVVLCVGDSSVFLKHNGHVEISGGPFTTVPLDALTPTLRCRVVTFWNWGDNLSGGHQGVDYHIARPVFKLHEFEVSNAA